MKYRTYFRASTVEEAMQMLKTNPENTLIVAGGTDVMVKARSRDWYAEMNILDIGGIGELRNITLTENRIQIGALVTIAELLDSELIRAKAEVLWQACKSFAVPQIRNRATIGGNLANACLAADTIPALCVLGAEIKAVSASGERVIGAGELLKSCPACLNHGEMAVSTCFYGVPAGKKTQLLPEEMITGVSFPVMEEFYAVSFVKVGRKQAGCMSKFTLAAALHMEQEMIADIRVCIGAAFSDIKMQSRFCEELRGKLFDEYRVRELSQKLGDVIEAQQKKPTEAIRYKAEVCRRLLPRTLAELCENAGGSV